MKKELSPPFAGKGFGRSRLGNSTGRDAYGALPTDDPAVIATTGGLKAGLDKAKEPCRQAAEFSRRNKVPVLPDS